MLKTPAVAADTWVEFLVEGNDNSRQQEHIKEGHYRHSQIESTTKVKLRPDFLFLYHISLNFTIVGLDHEVLKETNIICLPLPKRGEKPNIKKEEKSIENKETEEKKK